MTEAINEPIEVIAKFAGGKLTPLFFHRRGRKYRVESVEFVHSVKEGETRFYHFSVVGSGTLYRLIFNSQAFVWRLSAAETEAAGTLGAVENPLWDEV